MTQFLPPNLLALFSAREPIRYLPPTDKLTHEKKRQPYTGIADYLHHFEVSTLTSYFIGHHGCIAIFHIAVYVFSCTHLLLLNCQIRSKDRTNSSHARTHTLAYRPLNWFVVLVCLLTMDCPVWLHAAK